MAVATALKADMNKREASGIRSMFEAGILLKKQFGAENVYDFSLGNPDLEPPAKVVQAVQKLATLAPCGIHAYMPNAGLYGCRQAMALKTTQEQEEPVDAAHIVMCAGAAGALNVFLKSILNPGALVFVSLPFFPEYAHYAANHGGVLHPIPCKDDMSLDTAQFEKAFAQAAAEKKEVAAVILNSPNNPSGKIYDKKNIVELIEVIKAYARRTGKKPYLVCDEPYRTLCYKKTKICAVFPLYSESVIINSFAKNLSLPGERIGYIALNPAAENAAELIQACSFSNRILGFVNAPSFFQHVIEQSWDAAPDLSVYKKRRSLIMHGFDAAGLEYVKPEGAFYLFATVPPAKNKNRKKSTDDFAFCEHLKEYRILCVPGSVFGIPGRFRAAYCVSEDVITRSADFLKNACENW